MLQRKLRNQEEHEEIDLRIQKKQKLNHDIIEESIMAIASKVNSLRLSFSDLLQSSFFVYKNQSEFFSFVGCSISPHSR